MSNHQWRKECLSELISSFPQESQGLLGNLNSSTCNNHSFKRIFEEKTEICWITFVNHLVKDYPVVTNDKLYFKPKLLLFPLHLQRNILSMLLANVRRIPVDSLSKLDKALNEGKEELHEWTETMHKLLKVKINELENEYSQDKTMILVDVITDKSRKQFKELYSKIKSSARDTEQSISNISWSLVESCNKAHCSLADDCNTSDNSLEFISDVHDGLEKNAQMDVDEQIVDHDVLRGPIQSDCMFQKQPGSYNTLPEPPSELNIDDIVVDEDSSTALHSKLKQLQEIVQDLSSSETGQVCDTLQNELQVFSELSGTEMEEACNFLGLNSLCNENTVVVLIQAFMKIDPEPGYQSTCIFASKVILPCLQRITCPVSRLLGNSVMMLCEKFSSIISESLIFQLLIDPSLNSFQADFICKIIREKFNVDSNGKILSLLLDTNCSTGAGSFCWNDHIVAVVQATIDSNVLLEQEMLQTKFVSALQMNATDMSKSLKFTKLVVSIIKKYDSLVSAHKQSFITILDRNETFLKKAGMTSLKKIH